MSNAGKAVVIVQLKDGSIRLIRAEVVDDEESESGVAVELPFQAAPRHPKKDPSEADSHPVSG